jgi:DNA-binding response OmpR family regulator
VALRSLALGSPGRRRRRGGSGPFGPFRLSGLCGLLLADLDLLRRLGLDAWRLDLCEHLVRIGQERHAWRDDQVTDVEDGVEGVEAGDVELKGGGQLRRQGAYLDSIAHEQQRAAHPGCRGCLARGGDRHVDRHLLAHLHDEEVDVDRLASHGMLRNVLEEHRGGPARADLEVDEDVTADPPPQDVEAAGIQLDGLRIMAVAEDDAGQDALAAEAGDLLADDGAGLGDDERAGAHVEVLSGQMTPGGPLVLARAEMLAAGPMVPPDGASCYHAPSPTPARCTIASPMAATILIVEDEYAVSRGVQYALQQEGYQVVVAGSGEEGLTLAGEVAPDLLILDVRLPGIDGFETLRRLRSTGSKSPVLMLTARDEELDKVIGLELGADDYLTKPFGLRELLSRIKALLRRAYGDLADASGGRLIRHRDLVIDLERRRVQRGDRRISLTATEFEILRHLASRPGRVFSRRELLDLVRDYEALDQDEKTINVHVSHLREKLEDDPIDPTFILTIRGAGYAFAER